MKKIYTLFDLNKPEESEESDATYNNKYFKYNNPTYIMGYILGPNASELPTYFEYYILQLLEYLFVIYRYFQIPKNNNIINIHMQVTIYNNNNNKTIVCKSILDTGNEALTIIKKNILYKLGYNDDDFNTTYNVNVTGITGVIETMNTIYIHYKIADFVHKGYVAISSNNNAITKNMI